MKTDSTLHRWREEHAPRLLYGITALANAFALLRLFGLFQNIGPSTDLLNGFCIGTWIALAVFHLSGGASTTERTRASEGDVLEPPAIDDATDRLALPEPLMGSVIAVESVDRVAEERASRPR